MRPRALIFLALSLTACYSRRTVDRKDWGTLPEDRDITVQTLDGNRREFNRFVFTTSGLSAWRDSSNVLSDSALIPLDSIGVVRVSQFNKSATLLLAAAATTATFILLAQQKSDVRPLPQPRPSSCPFIYSFDGKDWIFDSETYAGAVAKSLERTDVDNLEHLKAVNGRYRIRMKNERPETDYTDELALLVVDHEKGTRAISDASGGVHVVGPGAAPLHTKEFGGDTIPSRAGWDLTFPRPKGDSAALVLRIRNTDVGPFALYHTLGLLGSDVYAWYAAMRSQPLARLAVRAWIEREGYLDVMLESGGRREEGGAEWRSVVRLPDVGAAIPKSQIVLIDLTAIRGDTVRVRLESSPGLWVLEQADLAELRGAAKTVRLHALRAIDERGADVAPLLAERDGKYLVTTPGSDVAFEYEAPALAGAQLTRSILVRTTGHYYVETDDRATPRREVVDRLMRDRAFAQQYFADAWVKAGGEPLLRQP
jgi:hypothetical protein